MAVLTPGLVGVMGDVHANRKWIVSQIPLICERLESPKIILQAGDFGVWALPGEEKWSFAGEEHVRKSFLTAVDEVLHDSDAQLWFVDGNHENHDLLEEIAGDRLLGSGIIEITARISWLRRGYRWKWHDRMWLACGGAVSVDKLGRVEGESWFPQEEIDHREEFMIGATGAADVLLSHDAPSDVPLKLMRPAPVIWQPMIPAAEDHRDRLQRICVAVKPSYIFHGHYHQSQVITKHAVWGKCRFTSLDMDGKRGNWGILDTRTMEWSW